MVPKKGKEMMDRAILKALLDTILKQMRTSIRDADLTKDYEVYSTKEFIVDYTKNVTDVAVIRKAIRDDRWLISKIAASAIYTIGQRVGIETKLKPDLVAIAAEAIHSYASSAEVKTKWAVSISRNERHWSMNIAVANVADVGEMPAMVFTWCLGREKIGE